MFLLCPGAGVQLEAVLKWFINQLGISEDVSERNNSLFLRRVV